MKGICKFQ